jgi:hypothetical protein
MVVGVLSAAEAVVHFDTLAAGLSPAISKLYSCVVLECNSLMRFSIRHSLTSFYRM